MAKSFFATVGTQNRDIVPGAKRLPTISQGLDSVRAYQFEIHFKLPSDVVGTNASQETLTLAAKQVGSVGFTSEDIEVNRVNDKVFYPGKASPEEVTVTFDNFYQKKVSNLLWNWFKSIYDPTKGWFADAKRLNGGNWKAQEASILHLDPHGQPLMETKLYGVYPKSWKTAEFNYSTNDFHTVEMTFRYDFMDHMDSTSTS